MPDSTTPEQYVIELRSANGDLLPSMSLIAKSAMAATLAAQELCPECELVRVRKCDEWQ